MLFYLILKYIGCNNFVYYRMKRIFDSNDILDYLEIWNTYIFYTYVGKSFIHSYQKDERSNARHYGLVDSQNRMVYKRDEFGAYICLVCELFFTIIFYQIGDM
jgi:hypothetical protein